ncbi:MAG: hypothetical protein HFJ26_06100 [Clostridia bacterium]|nr:hypothetical protein [Clostridia bacterium]
MGYQIGGFGELSTIKLYDLSQYESLTITISNYKINAKSKLLLGIKDEAGEWIVQKTPETNGDLVFDLRNIKGNGRICIEVDDYAEIYMSRIVLE